nr:embryogenesis-associated protein EMB8 isoform X2 [Ipomoea batatas]
MARASIGSAAAPVSSSFRHLSLRPLTSVFRVRSCSTASAAVAAKTPLMSDNLIPHPSLEVVGGARDAFLPALKSLQNPYNPYPIIGWNRHAETIFAAFFRSLPDLKLRRECLRTKDDGSVALDWVAGDDRRLPPDSPVLILLKCANKATLQPGLTGGSQDTYVRHMLVRARNKGWRVVVFNSRGCGNSPVTTSQVLRNCQYSVRTIKISRCISVRMATVQKSREDEWAGAEIIYGSEECFQHSVELLHELGFPKGVLPLKDLEECGYVRETGFVWMKQKAPYDHYFEGTKTLVSYAAEVTAYVEKSKMKKMTGVKSKQLLIWVPIVEMSIEDPAQKKIYFKTPMGIGRSFPITAFMTEEEKKLYLEKVKE